MTKTPEEILNQICEIFEKEKQLICGDESYNTYDQEIDEIVDRVLDPIKSLLCLYEGHVLVPDMCNKYEHDLCVKCLRNREMFEEDEKILEDFRETKGV